MIWMPLCERTLSAISTWYSLLNCTGDDTGESIQISLNLPCHILVETTFRELCLITLNLPCHSILPNIHIERCHQR